MPLTLIPGLSPDSSVIVSTLTSGGFSASTLRRSVPFLPSLAVTVSFRWYRPGTVALSTGVGVAPADNDGAPTGAPRTRFGSLTIFHWYRSLERRPPGPWPGARR
jgi:hypothetical protein